MEMRSGMRKSAITKRLLCAKKNSFASTYASKEKSALEYYAKLIESYKAIEN